MLLVDRITALAAIGLAVVLGACSATESIQEGVIHELAGTRWALVQLFGKSASVSAEGREPFVALQSTDARIVGYAGCNRITGR